jgi:hypothetical protein
MFQYLGRKAALPAMLLISFAAGSAMTGTALAVQGHMLSAQSALHVALNQLTVAIPDKGGYRVKAIADVNQALSDVAAGIAAGAP